MTTRLEKPLKRELAVNGRALVVAISPVGLKLTLKGKRNGLELRWDELISGDAALAVALGASLGRLETETVRKPPPSAALHPPKQRQSPSVRRLPKTQ